MEPVAIAGAAVVAAGTVAWEVLLHRRTQAAVRAEVRAATAKAQADRDAILARVAAIEARAVPSAEDVARAVRVPEPPSAEAIAAHVAEAIAPALAPGDEDARRARHFDDPDAARDARAAREERADAEAVAEADILAFLTESLGDAAGPAVIEYVKANAPAAWKRAVRSPKLAERILAPFVGIVQKMRPGGARGAGGGGGAPDPFTPAWARR